MRAALALGVLLALTTVQAAEPQTTADSGADALPPVCGEPTGSDVKAAQAILKGYGTGGFGVRTAGPQAQAYFDNGMQLAHAFAHGAATGAFKAAERADPTCAMCAWGEAWSRGPTINYPIDEATQKDLLALTNKAAVLAEGGPDKERRLIAALQKRYQAGGGSGPGDYAFAKAMDELARAYPDDSETAVMADDAWMIPAAMTFSDENVDRAVALLEGVLAKKPNDTAAIHFYIHATEMDHYGARALPYAQKLQALAPSSSHLTHMPSHTYFWVGHYRAAEQSNLDAVGIDKANAVRLEQKGGVFGLSYHFHNVQFAIGPSPAIIAEPMANWTLWK